MQHLTLEEGGRVAVLGGGPAGSFFAIIAITLARKLNRALSVMIFDSKDFAEVGPQGCNMCAGAIGSSLVDHLKEIGIPLPQHVVRQEVKGYAFHGAGKSAFLTPGPEESIYSVFRGGGPPGDSYKGELISFDQHLLDYARALGAEVIHQRVQDVTLPKEPGGRLGVKLKIGSHEVDLVVGAFGVNSVLPKRLGFGYRPPKTWHTCQTEVEVDRQFVREQLRDMIHIFSSVGTGLHFVAITPKGNHLTVTGIGPHVRIKDLEAEMRGPQVAGYLPPQWRAICHCHPQVPVSQARRPYADRLVIVGDASFSRYLKNGIESAFITAGIAARTALEAGIGSDDFHLHYYQRCRRIFSWDNSAGQFLFGVHRLVSRSPVLSRVCLDVVDGEQGRSDPHERRLSAILWHMFTGNVPYRRILFKGLSARLGMEFASCSLSLLRNLLWSRS